MTSTQSRPQSEGAAQLCIDQKELRSILSNLSHELSRPLISLRAGFDLLLGESPATISHHQRGHLLTMVSLCDDVLQLTRSYLDYAAIVQGSRPLCLGSFTIGALVDEINRQFEPIARARSLNWESRTDTPEIAVVTDASRCQQIFGNLVSNALKYTPVGGTVRLSARCDSHAWSVNVRDTGPGIPREALEVVFEPFFRLARDEHSGVEGSGLGLAICRELVHQLQGEIHLESELGGGTSISVRFPLSGSAATGPQTSKEGPSQPARKGGTRHKTTAPR
jgi:signal transduction histidine kinase